MTNTFLNALYEQQSKTLTANGGAAYASTGSACLDFFGAVGTLRESPESKMIALFVYAYTEDKLKALKTLFYARDIRGGLGERRIFRVIMKYLAHFDPSTVCRNIHLFAEYGRFDDLWVLLDTPCEKAMLELVSKQLESDLVNYAGRISLLGKWLPSINASSPETVKCAKKIAKRMGLTHEQYRKIVTHLRKGLHLVENNLRQKDYTFPYESVPSQANLKYREAFFRNDRERYIQFHKDLSEGKTHMNTATLAPYEIVAKCVDGLCGYDRHEFSSEQRQILDNMWKNLPDYTDGENALVVVDGSGSMYGLGHPKPAYTALSLGIYFAERSSGVFANHFITFSQHPRLVSVRGGDILEKVERMMRYNEIANTNIDAVFDLILKTAVAKNAAPEELPRRLFIISDMEFDECAEGADLTSFRRAKEKFAAKGYELPQVVFWNVGITCCNYPVRENEQGAALVSGFSPRLFTLVAGGKTSPEQYMNDVLESGRYEAVTA